MNITIREVGPRDGLQPEQPLPVEDRLALVRALAAAGARFDSGARKPAELARAAREILERTPNLKIEYVEAVDAETLKPVASLERPVVVAIAAQVGSTRLIDNRVFGSGL